MKALLIKTNGTIQTINLNNDDYEEFLMVGDNHTTIELIPNHSEYAYVDDITLTQNHFATSIVKTLLGKRLLFPPLTGDVIFTGPTSVDKSGALGYPTDVPEFLVEFLESTGYKIDP